MNSGEQFGLLYDAGEFIFPGSEKSGICKLYPLSKGKKPAFCLPVDDGAYFQDVEDDIHPKDGQKRILCIFKAVKVMANVFQRSFPVICIDVCFLKCSDTPHQLMKASFMTNERHLLPICFGTAERKTIKSWKFFMVNLRQV